MGIPETNDALELSRLFPSCVSTFDSTEPILRPLEWEEEALLGSVAERRRIDFTTGRACARQALSRLQVLPAAIGRGAGREPRWPSGICGSITHCDGYWAAAVAKLTNVRSLGVDAERRQVLSSGVLARITIDEERRWLQSADPAAPWELLLFSAKESVFKAWYPLVGTWLGFDEAHILFEPEARTFHARLLPRASVDVPVPAEIHGCFGFDATRVVTTVVIPASPR